MADVLRVSIKGTSPGGEVWSVNPVYKIGGDFSVSVSQVEAQAIATAIAARAVPTGLLNTMATSSSVTSVHIEARSRLGVLERQADAVKVSPGVGSGAFAHPFQTALVISLKSAVPGASGRGRMYWPATGIGITQTTLRPSAAIVLATLQGAETYLSGIDTDISATLTGVSLTVWSRKTGNTSNVVELSAGDVLDTQRRRRDAAVENYQTVSHTP